MKPITIKSKIYNADKIICISPIVRIQKPDKKEEIIRYKKDLEAQCDAYGIEISLMYAQAELPERYVYYSFYIEFDMPDYCVNFNLETLDQAKELYIPILQKLGIYAEGLLNQDLTKRKVQDIINYDTFIHNAINAAEVYAAQCFEQERQQHENSIQINTLSGE